jgi:hypothetical protein
MTDRQIDMLFSALWLGTGALLVGLIIAAPVMREPHEKIAPTTTTELVCHIDTETIDGQPTPIEKCNEEEIGS